MINLRQIIDQAVSDNVNAKTAIASVVAAAEQADRAATYANSAALNKQLVENKALEVANDKAAIETNTAIVAANLAETEALRDDAVAAKTLAEQYRDDALGFLSLTGLKYDHFDDRYLGAKSHNPPLDNDDWPIIDGAIYWNTTVKGMRVYDAGLKAWRNITAGTGALQLSCNLADLPDVAAARTNLSVYSKLETDAAIGAVVATKGQPNGIAPLNASGIIEATYLPSYIDDIVEVATKADLPVVGETDKIYVVVTDETSNNDTSTYRWTGACYAIVSNTLNGNDVAALYEGVPDVNRFTDAEKAKLASLTTGATDDQLASEVPYNNAVSGLVATNVQAAIDELDTNLKDAIADRYTKLEVDTKLAAQNEASEISVTPQGNLSSTTVQSALVELQADIDTLLVDIEW